MVKVWLRPIMFVRSPLAYIGLCGKKSAKSYLFAQNLLITTIHLFAFKGVSFSVAGPVNKYIAVNIPMSWSAAREYCNNTHLALATFTTWADLLMLRAAAGGSTHWIEPNEALETSTETIPVNPNPWEWSLGSILEYLNFKSGEPVVKCAIGVCVKMESNGTWIDQTCSSLNDFVCFAGKRRFCVWHIF